NAKLGPFQLTNPMKDGDSEVARLLAFDPSLVYRITELNCSGWAPDQMQLYRIADRFAALRAIRLLLYDVTLLEMVRCLRPLKQLNELSLGIYRWSLQAQIDEVLQVVALNDQDQLPSLPGITCLDLHLHVNSHQDLEQLH